MNKEIPTNIEAVRRLVVTKQHLAESISSKATTSEQKILQVVRDLAYVQWDPVPIVAPSHVISLWSRIGDFELSDLHNLLWKKKKLFLHWTPIASIVLTEDYPLYHSLMKRYPDSLSRSWGAQRSRAKNFLQHHETLRRTILKELQKRGPLSLTQFEEYAPTKRSADGWTPGNEISLMLYHLSMTGDVMVVGHNAKQNVWGLSEAFLPDWAREKEKKDELTKEEFECKAAERAIRALGAASPGEIHYYFVRGRYENLGRALGRLQEESKICRVRVEELGARDERYIHEDDVSLLESLGDAWEPHVFLIAPFDNLICGRDRTNRIFGFDYVHEQFLPKAKRKFGTCLLPILWGDKLIGRIDAQIEKKDGRLRVNSVHAEDGAPSDREISAKIEETIGDLARFLGAQEVTYTDHVPSIWKNSLH